MAMTSLDLIKLRRPSNWLLLFGLLAVGVPTFLTIAQNGWVQQASAHGPIILATGLWLLYQSWPRIKDIVAPVATIKVLPTFILLLGGYGLARVTRIFEIEGYTFYFLCLSILYGVIGGKAMRSLWFCFFYLLFVFPIPDTIVAAATNPLKIFISNASVWLLYQVGYPVAGTGVNIQIGQYQLLVAAACAGMNSIFSLSAIGLFYVYLQHRMNVGYALFLGLLMIPVAIAANLIRVLILILVTYHLGDAAAQSFFHDLAGMTMFVTSLLLIMGADALFSPLWVRFVSKRAET
jgi:exosortase